MTFLSKDISHARTWVAWTAEASRCLQWLEFNSLARRYGLAVLCAAGAVGLRWLFDPLVGDYVPLVTVYGFVALVVWQAGSGPALFMVVASYLAMNWLFIQPRYEFTLSGEDFWGLVAHATSVFVIVATGGAMRRARQQARNHAEQLKCEQRRLNEQARLLDLSHDAIIVRHPDGQIRYWNHGAEALYGWTAEEAVGRISHNLLNSEFSISLPDIQAELERTNQWTGELVHCCKDGRQIVALTRWVLERDAEGRPNTIMETNADITDRKRAEKALHEQEQRLRLAMTGSGMGAWDIDLASGAVIWDARQYEIFGRRLNDAPKNLDEFYELVHPDDVARIKQAFSAGTLTGRFSEEFRIVRPCGIVRWIGVHGAIVRDQTGRPVRIVGVNFDITDQKDARIKVQRFAEELERQVIVRTQELVDSQDRLRALATELSVTEQRERTRLATELHDHLQQLLVLGRLKLGGSLQLAQSPSARAEVMQQVDNLLLEALQYTRSLIADLSPPVLRYHGLLAALTWLGGYMKKHELTVTVHVPEEEELKLPEEQAMLLFQSVRELLINASKYAGTGCATVTLEQRDGQIRIEVRDEGVGFDLAAADTPNEKFSSRFGLFSIRERMKALGGTFEIASAPGKGTTVTLILPLDPSAESKVPCAVSSLTAIPEHSTLPSARARVLLVDDHAMVREGLRTVLEGYADIEVVGEASNGEEAVAAVKRLRPKVVVMDINMAKKNGIEATKEIKARYADTEILGLSVNADAENEKAMRNAGAAMLLTKEAAVDQLYAAVRKLSA